MTPPQPSSPSCASSRQSDVRFAWSRRLLALLFVFASLGLVVVRSPVTARADGSQTVVPTGTWLPTSFPPEAAANEQFRNGYIIDARAFAEPATRRLYTLGIYDASNRKGWLAAYDLDTLKPIGTGIATTGFATAVVTDAHSGDILIATIDNQQGGVVKIDRYASRLSGVQLVGSIDMTPTIPEQRIVGMYRPPRSSNLYVISELVAPGVHAGGITLTELLLDTPTGNPTLNWPLPLSDCFAPVQYGQLIPAGLGYVADKQALYFGCGNFGLTVAQSPVRRGIGRLTLAGDPTKGPTTLPTPADFTIFIRSGDYSISDSFFDPSTGRMLMVDQGKVGNAGTTVPVFDTRTDTYVGGIAVGNNQLIQSGVNPVIGRFYGIGPLLGLVATDLAPTPVGQGDNLPEYGNHGGSTNAIGNSPVAIDPATSRLFIKYSAGEFVIAVDKKPAYRDPGGEDPDASTVNVPEAPGKTDAAYSGEVQGFGFRSRQIGGINGLQVNYGIVEVAQVSQRTGGTRELRGAYLNQLGMTNGDSSASVISLDSDPANTKGGIALIAPPGGDPLAKWPVAPATCFDSGSGAIDTTKDASHAVCNAAGHFSSASSESGQATVGNLTVQHSAMTSSARFDVARGAVASVTSVARGIDLLAGVFRVGEVQATAEAWAKGRPGTNKSTFTRTVKDVTLNGVQLCSEAGENCDLQKIADQVNSQLAGRMRISFPEPDVGTRASDGGYQATIQRDRFEQLQEVLLNEQPADRLDVPAMVVTMYQDSSRPSRTVYEFAAVEAEARYGISVIGGSDDENGGGPLFGLEPELSAFTPTGGGFDGAGGNPSIGGLPGGGGAGPGGGAGSVGSPVEQAGRLIWNGLRRSAQLLPMWGFLLVPIYLSARRWLLFQRSSLSRGATR